MNFAKSAVPADVLEMLMYLLDTDILIYALKGNKNVLEHFQEKASTPKAISVITFG